MFNDPVHDLGLLDAFNHCLSFLGLGTRACLARNHLRGGCLGSGGIVHKPGQLTQGHRLERRPEAVVSGDLWLRRVGRGQEVIDRQAAIPALTRTHSGAAESLRLVRPEASETCKSRDRAGGDLFAAADYGVVCGSQFCLRGRIGDVEKGSRSQLGSPCPAPIRGRSCRANPGNQGHLRQGQLPDAGGARGPRQSTSRRRRR
ncbi:hypothetical protein RV134_90027 [Roseovarius sp. EC-HK134]|nr:hypothetical protein RV420_140027 [Roseovarius sp. EC-SD190]VVT34223.1 hypothetical protein RV134_90027 [Roseovarius sp. EC-HK134]